MAKTSRTKIEKKWTPPLPISSVMVLFIQFLTYKILTLYSLISLSNIYDFVDFWGLRSINNETPIAIVFYIYILLIGYILVEARSDWPYFPRFRNIIIYGVTLIVAIQGIIGLDILRRFNPYNPQQNNNTHFLRDAFVKNEFTEVQRLIAIGYEPFEISAGNRKLLDDYKWVMTAWWPTDEDWDFFSRTYFGASVFYYASASGIKDIKKENIGWYRGGHRHPYKQISYPKFDHKIFDYLLSLNPPKQQLQQAVNDFSRSGHTTALIKILDYDKDITPTFNDIEFTIRFCYADTSKILLKRLFDNSKNPNKTHRLLVEEFNRYITNFTHCTVPLRDIVNNEKYSLS